MKLSKKGKMNDTVQEAVIAYVRKNIHKHTGLYISWFGGEPLEALDVVEKLSRAFQNICKVAKKTYSAGMTTMVIIYLWKPIRNYMISAFIIIKSH